MEKEKMISIDTGRIGEYSTGNEETFFVGRCVSSSDEAILVEAYDPQGKWDGYYWIKRDEISDISYDTDYLKKIELYISYWNDKNPLMPTLNLKKSASMEARSVLELALEEKYVITIQRKNEEELDTGIISEMGNDTIILKCIDLENAEDLETIEVNIDDICFIEIDSPDNWLIKYAYEKNK